MKFYAITAQFYFFEDHCFSWILEFVDPKHVYHCILLLFYTLDLVYALHSFICYFFVFPWTLLREFCITVSVQVGCLELNDLIIIFSVHFTLFFLLLLSVLQASYIKYPKSCKNFLQFCVKFKL